MRETCAVIVLTASALIARASEYDDAIINARALAVPIVVWVGWPDNEAKDCAADVNDECKAKVIPVIHAHLTLAEWRKLHPTTTLVDMGIVVGYWDGKDHWMKTIPPKRCRGGVALPPGRGTVAQVLAALQPPAAGGEPARGVSGTQGQGARRALATGRGTVRSC